METYSTEPSRAEEAMKEVLEVKNQHVGNMERSGSDRQEKSVCKLGRI